MDKFHIKIGELMGSREPVYLDLRKLVETRALIEASSGGGKSTLMRLIAERAAGVMQTIGSEMNLTESGFSALGADVPLPPQSFNDIVALWREVLNDYERALFDALLRAPHGLTLDELSERSGKSKSSSKFQSTVAMFVKNKIATRRGERITLHNPLS